MWCTGVCATSLAMQSCIAIELPHRVVVLASPQLFACANETDLKILELTAGEIVVLTETFLAFVMVPRISSIPPDSCWRSSLRIHLHGIMKTTFLRNCRGKVGQGDH